jgi:hypothetical protein
VSLADLLVTTIEALEAEAIPYMLTGSLASSFHGEPRATRDIDIVIDPSVEGLTLLVDRLHRLGLYVDEATATAALRDRGQFNAIAADAKVDFVIRKDHSFSRTEFERRKRVRLPQVDAYIVSVEDLILAKLVWAQQTGSDRQLRDVAAMIAATGDRLDVAYVDVWAERLNVIDVWRRLLAESKHGD